MLKTILSFFTPGPSLEEIRTILGRDDFTTGNEHFKKGAKLADEYKKWHPSEEGRNAANALLVAHTARRLDMARAAITDAQYKKAQVILTAFLDALPENPVAKALLVEIEDLSKPRPSCS